MGSTLPQEVGDLFETVLQDAHRGDLSQVKENSTLGSIKILELKEIHRMLCEDTEALGEGTVEAKIHLDQSSLQLQNLLYEKHHYEKEIEACTSFRSAFPEEKLELSGLAEFAADPQATDLQTDDPHQLMLNRLKHELALRQAKMKELEELKAKRDALAADVAQKRSALVGLDAELGRLRTSAQRVRTQYGVP